MLRTPGCGGGSRSSREAPATIPTRASAATETQRTQHSSRVESPKRPSSRRKMPGTRSCPYFYNSRESQVGVQQGRCSKPPRSEREPLALRDPAPSGRIPAHQSSWEMPLGPREPRHGLRSSRSPGAVVQPNAAARSRKASVWEGDGPHSSMLACRDRPCRSPVRFLKPSADARDRGQKTLKDPGPWSETRGRLEKETSPSPERTRRLASRFWPSSKTLAHY